MSRRRHQLALAAFLVAVVACAGIPQRASADTLEFALAQAYLNNPLLNAQRALVRATDESVPQALSGYRPRVLGDGKPLGADQQCRDEKRADPSARVAA